MRVGSLFHELASQPASFASFLEVARWLVGLNSTQFSSAQPSPTQLSPTQLNSTLLNSTQLNEQVRVVSWRASSLGRTWPSFSCAGDNCSRAVKQEQRALVETTQTTANTIQHTHRSNTVNTSRRQHWIINIIQWLYKSATPPRARGSAMDHNNIIALIN